MEKSITECENDWEGACDVEGSESPCTCKVETKHCMDRQSPFFIKEIVCFDMF